MSLRKSKKAFQVIRVTAQGRAPSRRDSIITEEPLEIRLKTSRESKSLAITMRTPGHDFELTAGFLFSEGIVHSRHDFSSLTYCVDKGISKEQRYNIVNVNLNTVELPDFPQLERHFFTTSACGICGKASLDALEQRGLLALASAPEIEPGLLLSLPEKLRTGQTLFEQTGGLHAAALFSNSGELLTIREDVGRHNALDKVIGWALLEERLPLTENILLVSGRASYELVQKALSAGISVFCSVSAPSSLAIDLAKRFNMTLIGFLREDSFNLYNETALRD
ncbi:MAG: formate dehydrogenase accessory sulfurtransferase FdhD [Trueperaceae bacterium]|nr:formate dehydrogenase accessory sulfurtransferase FdhD [Trueperaceae bacterium]